LQLFYYGNILREKNQHFYNPGFIHLENLCIIKGCGSAADMQQKMAKMFTSGRKRQNWYIWVLEHADSEF